MAIFENCIILQFIVPACKSWYHNKCNDIKTNRLCYTTQKKFNNDSLCSSVKYDCEIK